jgi:hypothetical protein
VSCSRRSSAAPIIGLLLIEWAGGGTWAFSLYLIAILVLAAVSVLIAGETMHRDIGRVDKERNESVPPSIRAEEAPI